jgi:nicotinic acid mononucleotide adenylyltransferase
VEILCKLNPKVDFAFKKLFGSEENKSILISFINSIVSEENKIKNVELKNPYNISNYRKGKSLYLMQALKDIYKEHEFYIILGSDNANNIKTFFNYDELLKMNNFCIIERKGSTFENKQLFNTNLNNMFVYNDNNILEISSTFIRDNIHNIDIIKPYLNPKILNYLIQNDIKF